MGETTGTKSPSSRVVSTLGSTRVMLPTRPRAGSLTTAVMSPPSLPEMPTPETSNRARSRTMALFTWADRAISAASRAASSVTR